MNLGRWLLWGLRLQPKGRFILHFNRGCLLLLILRLLNLRLILKTLLLCLGLEWILLVVLRSWFLEVKVILLLKSRFVERVLLLRWLFLLRNLRIFSILIHSWELWWILLLQSWNPSSFISSRLRHIKLLLVLLLLLHLLLTISKVIILHRLVLVVVHLIVVHGWWLFKLRFRRR